MLFVCKNTFLNSLYEQTLLLAHPAKDNFIYFVDFVSELMDEKR